MNRPLLLGLCAAATLAAAFFWALRPPPDSTPSLAPEESRGLLLGSGVALRYRFELEHHGLAPITAELPMEIEIDLAGELELVGLGEHEIELRLESLERGDFRMAGAAFPKIGDLRAARALAVLSDTGALTAVRFRSELSSDIERVLHLLLLELQFQIDPAPIWTRVERRSLGEAEVHYRRTSTGIERRLGRYSSFGGLEGPELEALAAEEEAEFELEADGRLTKMASKETYAGPRFSGQKTFRLTRIGKRPVPAAELAVGAAGYAELRRPGDVRSSTTSLEQALLQRVEGLTKERCLADLIEHEASGRMPDHERWLWRASGLMRLHPELADEMVPLLERETMSSAGRALIFDLLAHVGHADAQAALRKALGLASVRADPDYHLLYQRLSFVNHPDAETRHFVKVGLETAPPALRNVAAHALGSVAGASHRSGDTEEAAILAEPLLESLRKETAPEKQAELLGALGNAGLPEHTTSLLGYVASPHVEVRFQMAGSLRKLEGPEVTRALVELATDASGATVQRRALSTLAQRPMEDAALSDLCDRVRRGMIAPEAQGPLVTVLARFLPDPRARAALESLLTAPSTMVDVRARIRSVLSAN